MLNQDTKDVKPKVKIGFFVGAILQEKLLFFTQSLVRVQIYLNTHLNVLS